MVMMHGGVRDAVVVVAKNKITMCGTASVWEDDVCPDENSGSRQNSLMVQAYILRDFSKLGLLVSSNIWA